MESSARGHDVDRMISFIYHESKETKNELNIKANEEYNTEKNRIISEETERIRKKYEIEEKRLHNMKVLELTKIKRLQSFIYLKEKEAIINRLFDKVKEELRYMSLSEDLVKECAHIPDPIIFCKDSDRDVVKRHLKGEFKRLNDDFLGGIIVCSRDGKDISDNSFLSRMDMARERYMKFIASHLFDSDE